MPPAAQFERTTHRVFVLTLAAKGALGAVQLATALAIGLGLFDALPDLAHQLFRAELAQDPHDFVATTVLAWIGALPENDLSFYQIYFAAHGVLHLGIVAALIYGARWADVAAILVLAGFVVYQMIEWALTGGVTLIVLSVIDLFVIALTMAELRRKKRTAPAPKKTA